MPLNIKFYGGALGPGAGYPTPYPPALASNIARIDEIFAGTRARFGSGGEGPFLFGRFCAADAMYAPVCLRLRIYGVEVRKGLPSSWTGAARSIEPPFLPAGAAPHARGSRVRRSRPR